MIEIIAESTKYNASKKIKDILKKKKTKHVSDWWYLHGKLEKDVGFDKGIMLDNDYLKCLEHVDKDKHYKVYYLPDGIYPIKITQIDKPCIGYFWTTFKKFGNIKGIVPYMRGLVCYKDDINAIEYAYKKYIEKSEIL